MNIEIINSNSPVPRYMTMEHRLLDQNFKVNKLIKV